MKAQFATIEAIISLVLAASVVSFAYTQLNGETSAFASSARQLRSSAAAYDMLNLFAENATANACLGAYLLDSSAQCMQSIADDYGAELHVGGMSVSANTLANSTCGDIRLVAVNTTQRVCVVVGG